MPRGFSPFSAPAADDDYVAAASGSQRSSSQKKVRLDENGFPIEDDERGSSSFMRRLASPLSSFRGGSGNGRGSPKETAEEAAAAAELSAKRSKLMAHKGGVFGGQRIEEVKVDLVQQDEDEVTEQELMRQAYEEAMASASAITKLGMKLGAKFSKLVGKADKGLNAELNEMGAAGKMTKMGMKSMKSFAGQGIAGTEEALKIGNMGVNQGQYYYNKSRAMLGVKQVMTPEELEELAEKIELASKARPEVTAKMHAIGAAQKSGESKNLKPVMASQRGLNRAYKASLKMHLYHAQQSEKKRRFSFSETDAGSAVQAALAKTYLHMMDPSSNELSKEIKETREEMEWALNRDDYSVEQLQVYKFNKPGRQFVKWSQPKLDPRLSYLVENTAEVLHKNITVRDRTVRAAAEQHMNNEGRSWRSLGHTERLKNGVFGTDITTARSVYYEKVLMCTKEEGGDEGGSEMASEVSKFSDAEEQQAGTAAGSVVSDAFKSAVSDDGDENDVGLMQKLKLSTPSTASTVTPKRSPKAASSPSREATPAGLEGTTPMRAKAGDTSAAVESLPFPTSNSYNNLLFTEGGSPEGSAGGAEDEVASVLDDFDDASQLLAESTVATARRPAAAADDAPLEDVGTVVSILDSENDQAAGSDLARVLDDQSTVAGSVMEPASPSLQGPAQGGGGLSRMGPPPSDGRVLRRKGSGVSDRL